MPGMVNAYALVVGIARYRNTNAYLRELPPAICKDATDAHALLIDPSHGGYAPDNAVLLLDEQATLAGLRGAMADLAARCDANSIVTLFYSGHGGHTGAGEYLLPHDVVYAPSNGLRADSAFSGEEFSAALSAIPAARVTVLFDCCHAAAIGHIKGDAAPPLQTGLPERYYERLQTGRGRVILASSRSTESSWLMPGDANSLFTKHLLAGLSGGVAAPDGFVRIFDLFEYVQPRVTGEQPLQHPIFQSQIEENFPIALSLGGQKGSMAVDEDGFLYDAYITFADVEPDAGWVWGTLVPRLRDAGLRVAVSTDVEEPGVALVLGIERAIRRAKRTVAVISRDYLTGAWTSFQEVMAATLGVQEQTARVLPLVIDPELLAADGRTLGGEAALHLGMLTPLNLHERYGDPFARLIRTLRAPLASTRTPDGQGRHR